jgi:hypothetical protein
MTEYAKKARRVRSVNPTVIPLPSRLGERSGRKRRRKGSRYQVEWSVFRPFTTLRPQSAEIALVDFFKRR